MKVLLVNTNRMKPAVAPIGLDYLADGMRAAGHDLSLVDLCFSADPASDLKAAVGAFDPQLIGISVRNTDDCYLSSSAFFLPEVREALSWLRDCSEAPIVLGGVGFSVMPEAVMEYCGADYAVAGDGEHALVSLAAALTLGEEPDQVPGVLYWNGIGLRRNPTEELRLDQLAPRTRSFVDNPRYFREGGQAGFETRRGCAMGCTYCADPVSKGRRVRLLDPRMVAAELSALLSQGIDHFHTCDCEFNVPPDHARAVCHAILDAGLAERIRWHAYCAAAPFDAELALLARRAGCAGIDFGVDSLSPGMLKRLGRPFDPEDVAATARAARAAGIPFMFDLLLGGPGETRETIRETVDRVREIGPDCIGVSLGVRVYDGTPIAADVRAMGPMDRNPALVGARLDNESLLRPVFYVSPALGADPARFLQDLVGDDPRFFLPSGPDKSRDYNYNDNELLVRAIADGARGAYWDILRKLRA